MTQLARINVGDSEYADRLWTLLSETGIEREEFESLDYFSLVPFFILAGATVTPQINVHGDHFHFQGVTIDVPEEMEEMFYDALPHMLGQVEEEEDHEGHSHG